MRSLSAAELLSIWERGLTQTQVERGLTLLTLTYHEKSPDELANLPVGQRDALLLDLREQIFGPKLVAHANCPNCSEHLELTFNIEDIRATAAEQTEVLSVSEAGYSVRFRLPNSLDLISTEDQQSLAAMRQILLEQCLLDVIYEDEAASKDRLPAEVVEAMVRRMAEADPQADIQLALSCPECSHEWQMAFDIVLFLWNEINGWALRILQDVHMLASAYGWSEAEILSMSSWRRQAYLDLVVS